MDEIESGLYVSGVDDIRTESVIVNRGLTAVVSLTHDQPFDRAPDSFVIERIPLLDGPQHDPKSFQRAVRATRAFWRADEHVLVHCSAGASRSPAVAATVIALETEKGLTDAFQHVHARRDGVAPHNALIERAASVYKTWSLG